MALHPDSLLALAAAVGWPAWALAGVVALSSAFWFSRRGEEGEPSDESATSSPGGRSAEDAIRIRELQETVDELTRLRAAALEAAQRRDEFLTTISHELRSPLNAILGWTQVLEPRRDLPPDVRDALQVIRRNALRQRQLLDDLVDMSRVVSGALRIEPRPMRIQDALEEACQAVRPEMDRKGIHLDCIVDSPAIVSGDARRLQQVLRNLLSNAIRFTPTGGTITIRSTRGASEVSLIISDTGAGIDPGFLPHVFEPFRQQPGAAPRDQTTFGLGLALARIIVVGHGGRVTAHSDGPGRGSTFTVTLPTLATEAGRGLGRAWRCAEDGEPRRRSPACACWPSTTSPTGASCSATSSARPAPMRGSRHRRRKRSRSSRAGGRTWSSPTSPCRSPTATGCCRRSAAAAAPGAPSRRSR